VGEKIERILGWVAAAALLLAAVALVITYVPGVRPWFDKVVAAMPHSTPIPTIDDAQEALDRGDSAQASRIATDVVASSSSDANVDNHAGNIALSAGDDTTAERDYLLGEAADDKNPWNYVALGELYARQGRFQLADTQLRAALTIVPGAQFLHYDLGVAELREHLADSALADFEAELKKSPGYLPALEGRAEALGMLGRPLDPKTAHLVALAKLRASPKPSASPSPSPSASPSPSPGPTPSASPSPTPTASPSPSPSPTPVLTIAKIIIPSPSPSPKVKSSPSPRVVRARPEATPIPLPTPSPSPVAPLPRSIADLASEAKGYLFDIASDPGFTHALPFADPTRSIASMQSAIQKGSVDDVLSAGTAAMLTHHFSLAQTAFAAATDKAQTDWRGPYLAGINAQQRGDQAAARTFFTQAASRGAPSAVYVSLAIADVAEGADTEARDSAQHAVQLQPGSANALFTAGVVDLLMADAPSAERDLGAAAAASDAPDRTTYFLTTLRQRVQIPQ
jgi:tetratricopeptide (TPR) repeat protein